jgi:hypothetical protein
VQVHLKRRKWHKRTVREQAVSWPTAPVPVGELSVELQADILELQVNQHSADMQRKYI